MQLQHYMQLYIALTKYNQQIYFGKQVLLTCLYVKHVDSTSSARTWSDAVCVCCYRYTVSVKNHFEIMSHIYQNTLNKTKMRLDISVSHFYVSNLRFPHYNIFTNLPCKFGLLRIKLNTTTTTTLLDAHNSKTRRVMKFSAHLQFQHIVHLLCHDGHFREGGEGVHILSWETAHFLKVLYRHR